MFLLFPHNVIFQYVAQVLNSFGVKIKLKLPQNFYLDLMVKFWWKISNWIEHTQDRGDFKDFLVQNGFSL